MLCISIIFVTVCSQFVTSSSVADYLNKKVLSEKGEDNYDLSDMKILSGNGNIDMDYIVLGEAFVYEELRMKDEKPFPSNIDMMTYAEYQKVFDYISEGRKSIAISNKHFIPMLSVLNRLSMKDGGFIESVSDIYTVVLYDEVYYFYLEEDYKAVCELVNFNDDYAHLREAVNNPVNKNNGDIGAVEAYVPKLGWFINGWTDKESICRINTGNNGKIRIQGSVPPQNLPNKLTVMVDKEIFTETEITDENIDILLEGLPKNKNIDLYLGLERANSPFAYSGGEIEDYRVLGIQIRDIKAE